MTDGISEAGGPEVTCVVVAFHDAGSLRGLLSKLAHPAVQRLVVNVEDDPAVAHVCRTQGATAVPLPDNPGYAAAVNRGVAASRAPAVVFMNDDVDVDAITALDLARLVYQGQAKVVVPAIVGAGGEREPTIHPLPTPWSLAREWMLLPDRPVAGLRRVVHAQKWRAPSKPERVLAATAAVVAARRDLLRRVPLPEQYFLYWEESEWFWWLHRDGTVVEYHPELSVLHRGGRDEVRPAKSRLLARNAVRCVRRTQGPAAAASSFPVVVLWNVRLVVAAAVRAGTGGDRGRSLLRARLAGLQAAVGAWTEVRRVAA